MRKTFDRIYQLGIVSIIIIFAVAMRIESTRIPEFAIVEQRNFDNLRIELRRMRELQTKIQKLSFLPVSFLPGENK